MPSIPTTIDPQTSILRLLAKPALSRVITEKGFTLLGIERLIGRSGGYLCRIVDRTKSISHHSACQVADILACPVNDLFAPDHPSGKLIDAWLAGEVMAIDGDNARFWSKVSTPSSSGCWIWRASKNTAGYGQIMMKTRPVLASRRSYEISNGPIPDGLHVLHHCDNPPCVNPDHLFLGTHTDNMRDMFAKKRRKSGGKLTLSDVHRIREINPITAAHKNEIARQFGVSASTIRNILNRRRWIGV